MRLIITLVLLAVLLLLLRRHRRQAPALTENPDMHRLLEGHVAFYKRLDITRQQRFRVRVQHFLDTVRITPVGSLKISDLDRLYVASSAIIPIFSFDDWAYNNLNEVLLYPGAFTRDFRGRPEEQEVLGMVGDGAMHRMMLLSVQSLRNGFEQSGKSNTGIHEFVHLLDKADGATDGIPEAMLPAALTGPWINYMHQAIREIRTEGSDIDEYAGRNEVEFFAVISEYFFQKPEQLAAHHPQLFRLLEQIYRRKLDV